MNKKLHDRVLRLEKKETIQASKTSSWVKESVVEIHEESYQIYGAPKITEILQTNGHKIAQRTVSKCMNEEGIIAHYVKPYTTIT